MRVGKCRINFYGLAQVSDRFLARTLERKEISKICVRLHKCGINLHGAAEFVDRLSQCAALSEHKTQIVMGKTRLFINSKRMSPQPLRVMPDLGLMPTQHAKASYEQHGKRVCENQRSYTDATTGPQSPAIK